MLLKLQSLVNYNFCGWKNNRKMFTKARVIQQPDTLLKHLVSTLRESGSVEERLSMTSTFLGNVKLNQHCMRGQSIVYKQGHTSVAPLHFVCGVFGLLFYLNSLFHWGKRGR